MEHEEVRSINELSSRKWFCFTKGILNISRLSLLAGIPGKRNRGTQRQFSENICSEDDLRSPSPRIFRTFFVKFLACLPLLGFSNNQKTV